MIPSFYIVLGSLGSGRREIALDLAKAMADEGKKTSLLFSKNEQLNCPHPLESDNICVSFFNWNNQKPVFDHFLKDSDAAFWVMDGSMCPIDQIEWAKNYLDREQQQVTRVIMVVDCVLAFEKTDLQPWFEACVHFADVALLTKYEEVPNAFLNSFLDHFKKDCYPCLFEKIKNNRVNNPYAILDDQPRRMSLIFDNLDSADTLDIDGYSDDFYIEEPINLEVKIDPYFEKMDNGMRVKPVPAISQFLKK